MLFHLGGVLAFPKYFDTPVFSYIFAAGGAAGVDFFFVLSGFIIMFIHSKDIDRPNRLAVYAYKRAARIYPTYWTIFVGVWLIAYLVPTTRDTVPTDPWLLLKAAALVPLDPGIVGGTGAPVIVVAWSLQYEMLFYVMFGLLILNRNLGIAASVLVAGWAVAVAFFGWHGPLSFLQPAYFVLFVAGTTVGSMVRRTELSPAASASLFWSGVTVFLLTSVTLSLKAAFPDLLPTVPDSVVTLAFGAAASMALFGIVSLEKQGRAPTWPKVLLHLGDASYVLYLIHFPAVSLCCKIAVFIGLSGLWGAVLTVFATVTVCAASAIAFHLIIEEPLLVAARKWLDLSRASRVREVNTETA